MMNGKTRGKRCGWLRVSRAAGEKAQRKMLEDHGAHPIFDAKTMPFDDMVTQLRFGDEVAVTSLGRLAHTRAALRHAIDAIHSKKCIIVEIATGRQSNRAAEFGQMVLDGVNEITSDARGVTPEEASRYGRIGGQITKARVKREMEGKRMPKAEARNIWMNPLITGPEALAQMTGWTQASAYRILKSRKLAKGRPRKSDKP